MKLKSLLILIVAGLFVLSCAVVGPKSDPLTSDSQAYKEQRWVSGIQYYLEDIYEYYDEPYFITKISGRN